MEGQPRWIAKHIRWMRTATFQPTAVPIFSQLFPKRSVQWTPMLGSHAFLHPIELVSPLRMPPLSNVQSASSFSDAQVRERSQHRKTSSHPPPPCPKISDWWSFDDNSNLMTMLWHSWQVTLSQMWDLLAGKSVAQTGFFSLFNHWLRWLFQKPSSKINTVETIQIESNWHTKWNVQSVISFLKTPLSVVCHVEAKVCLGYLTNGKLLSRFPKNACINVYTFLTPPCLVIRWLFLE